MMPLIFAGLFVDSEDHKTEVRRIPFVLNTEGKKLFIFDGCWLKVEAEDDRRCLNDEETQTD